MFGGTTKTAGPQHVALSKAITGQLDWILCGKARGE